MKKPDCKKCREENKEKFAISTFGLCNTCEKMKKYEAFRESKRLYTKGEPITTLDILLEQTFITFCNRTKHIEMIKNMSLRTVLNGLKGKSFYYAIRKGQNNE